jgi:tripartite-type tricarboxylate transporter receptor subunit TctC
MMKLRRREFLHLAAGASALALGRHSAWAEVYPSRPVRIVVGFPPGGTTDIVARQIGQWLSQRLGQQFIIENRPGANTNIASEAVTRAAPDGYTLVTIGSSSAINATLYDKLTFNLNRDLVMVAGLNYSPLVLEVNPAVPANSVAEFIAYAKAHPGKISLASFGTGSISHVAGELFKTAAGVSLLHVPYRGSGPMLNDLLGGQVQAAMDNLPASIGHIKADRLRALAVTTATRSEALPQVPSLHEFLPGYEASAFIGLAAPKGTPDEVVAKLNKEINAGLADPKLKARLADLGGMQLALSAPAFGEFLAEETEKWAKVVKFSGAKPD